MTTIGRLLDIKPRTIYRWYKDHLSDYYLDKATGKFAGHSVMDYDESTGEVKQEQLVHIVQPENIGANMCIDEKMINKHYTVILSNRETGQISLLVDTC